MYNIDRQYYKININVDLIRSDCKAQLITNYYMNESMVSPQNFNSPKNGIENKEIPILPTISIFYRENDLFKTLIPKIIDELNNLQRKVTVHSFPEETPLNEISDYFDNKDVKSLLKNKELLLDGTCSNQMNYYHGGIEDLDLVALKIMGPSFLNKPIYQDMMHEKGREFMGFEDQLCQLKDILKKIIEKHGDPEMFYIVAPLISDHNFSFFNIFGSINVDENTTDNEIDQAISKDKYIDEAVELGLEKTTIVSYIKLRRLNRFSKNYNDDLYQKTLKEDKQLWDNIVSSKIKDHLKEIITEDKIQIVQSKDDVKEGDKNFVLADRHSLRNPKYGREINNKITLPLPFVSMVYHIINNNLLEINLDMDNEIKTTVDKVFKNT